MRSSVVDGTVSRHTMSIPTGLGSGAVAATVVGRPSAFCHHSFLINQFPQKKSAIVSAAFWWNNVAALVHSSDGLWIMEAPPLRASDRGLLQHRSPVPWKVRTLDDQ
jgi:hypothetical protein